MFEIEKKKERMKRERCIHVSFSLYAYMRLPRQYSTHRHEVIEPEVNIEQLVALAIINDFLHSFLFFFSVHTYIYIEETRRKEKERMIELKVIDNLHVYVLIIDF